MLPLRAARRSGLVVLAALAILLPSQAVAATTTAPAEQATESPADTSPSAVARRTGKPVAVPSKQTATSDVVANPDGTFTETFHTEPIRVRRGSGWAPIDTTLVRRSDGSIGPRATTVPTSFSAGGRDSLVQLGPVGQRIAYSWAEPLPTPVLAGSTATYRDVLPDFDLQLTAKPQGFAKAFVVRTPAAARKLTALRLGLSSDSLKLRDTGAGSFGAYGRDGKLVYTAGEPAMWDAGTKRALGTSTLDATGLTVRPDRALLTDPGAKYPITIDPDTGGPLYGWSQVFSGKPGTAWWNGDGSGVAKVGQCYNGNGDCNGIAVARSFFRFDVRGMLPGDKIVKSASFNAFLSHKPNCAVNGVKAWSTAPVGPTTSWSNQPGLGAFLGEHAPGCAGVWLGWQAARAVTDGVSLHGGWATVALTATNESDQLAWKKFDQNRVNLSVTYNTRPGVPGALTVENERCAGQEIFVNPAVSGDAADQSRGPRLFAIAADADPGLIRTHFEWRDRTGQTVLGGATTGWFGSGTNFGVEVDPANSVDGKKLSFRVKTLDGQDESYWSGYCNVTIDKVGPLQPPVVSSPTYSECLPDGTCTPSGSVGFTGGFAFKTGGDTDVAGFQYSLHGEFENRYAAVGSDGLAHVLVTPPDRGPQFLTVRAVDRARNVSSKAYVYEFFVGRGAAPKAAWRLDGEGADTAVIDDAAGDRNGVRPAVGVWKDGRHGDALWLNGSTAGYVSMPGGPAVDTGKSFSVSAWVKLDEAGTAFRTAVSQDGTRLSGFFLQYNPNSKKWNFMMPASDADAAARHVAESAGPAVAGRWTHLLGVFDDAAKQVKLYVDGVEGTVASHPNPWSATGATQLGRARYQAAGVDHWLGSLDDVQLYNRVLAAGEIDDLAAKPTTEELFWPFDEADGSQVSDASGNYRLGTAGTGVTRIPGTVGSGAVRFDGSGTGVTGPGAVLRTDTSFTVSARVKLDAVDGITRTVLSQDGAQSSGFQLGYDGAKRRWSFGLSQADTAADAPITVTDDSAPTADQWTLLTGVYDHAAGQIRLYVDGRQVGGFVAAQAKWNATGAFQVGQARKAGQPANQFLGEVDDVHLWTGVRAEGQIQDDRDHPVASRSTAYSGQLSYYLDTKGFRMVTTGPVPQSPTSRAHSEYRPKPVLRTPGPSTRAATEQRTTSSTRPALVTQCSAVSGSSGPLRPQAWRRSRCTAATSTWSPTSRRTTKAVTALQEPRWSSCSATSRRTRLWCVPTRPTTRTTT